MKHSFNILFSALVILTSSAVLAQQAPVKPVQEMKWKAGICSHRGHCRQYYSRNNVLLPQVLGDGEDSCTGSF